LIRGSFVPPTAVQELRTLTRTRKQLVRERTAHVQRLDKVLPDANLKLGSVLTDIMGQSGRAVLAALVRGETAPEHLATLVSPRVKAARPDIVEALRGHLTSHHRFLLQRHLDQVATLEGAIAKVDAEVGTTLAPFQLAARRLSTIPGVSAVAAAVIMSEIGIDMTRFPTAGHLISWAGLCPKNDASAGKRRSTRLRKGAPWLKTTLVQAAWCATRAKDTYLRAQFVRLKGRRGPRKAIIAVAASILTAAYFMLLRDTDYQDLGAAHFGRVDPEKAARRLVRQLTELGFQVALRPAA
jgi:transposase